MSNKTINQALKDLFIGLGGDPSALADNDTVSDYIADLESAIKACASGESEDLIDDTEASENKTYSSSKIESIIPEDELPSVTSEDNGKVLKVIEGEWGAASLPSSGYSETVIYTGEVESGTTVNLTDSIANYDAIMIGSNYSNPVTGDDYDLFTPYLSTRSLIGIDYKLPIAYTGQADVVVQFEFKSATSLYCGSNNINKVIGVKFN